MSKIPDGTIEVIIPFEDRKVCGSCKRWKAQVKECYVDDPNAEWGNRAVVRNDFGLCSHPMLVNEYIWCSEFDKVSTDSVLEVTEGGALRIMTGKDFGCIHWESKL